ncbi:MAG: DUF4838 domain-containing protein [Clostridia bacterium]|nr:DUF4838 domain-containing protein [Clostridia bacterium]
MKTIRGLLALLQVILCAVGLLPVDRTVNYGGTPYAPAQIEEPLYIVKDRASDYSIAVEDGADACLATAAKELQTYAAKCCGVTLPITQAADLAADAPAILLETAPTGVQTARVGFSTQDEESFRLFVEGGRLHVRGTGPRGTLYGVYTLLEQALGVRWFTPTLEVTPESADFIVDTKLDEFVKPSFSVRRNDCPGTNDAYRARSKMNVSFWRTAEDYGGALTYVLWDVTLDRLVPDALFDAHPDYFAQQADGSRSTDHVCLSHPEVLAVAIENACAAIQADPRGAKYLHVGQKDNENYCRCALCEAAYAQYGSVSAPTILFTNALAEALEEDYPDFMFTFYAYNETDRPPTDPTLRCRDNVAPVLCGLHKACRCHALTACGAQDGQETFDNLYAPREATIAEDFKVWTQVADTTYIYDYTINFLNTAQFFSNLETMQSTMQYMHDIGITGYIYNCGDGHEAAFNELRNYLLCRLQWDVNCDVAHCMEEFLRAFYGEEAAPYIREILDLQTAQIRATAHAFDFDWHYQSGFFPPLTAAKLDALWEKALAADGTQAQRFNVEKANLSWEYYKANLFMGKYTVLNPLRSKANEALYDAFRAHGVERVCSFGLIPEKSEIDFLQRPYNWR